MGPEQIAIRSCNRCVRKAVCILYHGYTQMDLRYGNPGSLDPEQVVSKLSEALAYKCNFYLEVDEEEPETKAGE